MWCLMIFNNRGLRLRGAILTILIGFLVWHMKMIKLRCVCVGGGGGGGGNIW